MEYSYKNLRQEFYRSNLKLYNMYYKVYNLQLKENIIKSLQKILLSTFYIIRNILVLFYSFLSQTHL